MLRKCFAIDLDAERDQFVFAGDSRTTRRCSEFFPNAVGWPTSPTSPTA